MEKPEQLSKFSNLYRNPYYWLIAVIAIVIISTLVRNYFLTKHTQQVSVQSVVIAAAYSADVPVYLSALGTITPTDNVTVRTQIDGQLLQVLFEEGQLVKKDQLLAIVDPRSYEAQLTQYQGQLARDTALLNNAKLDLKRYEQLWKQDSVAKQTLDAQKSLVKQYEGTVKNDEGLIAATQLRIDYCHIKSPIAGRVGLRQVDAGNLVKTTDTNGIVIINTLNPVAVIFTLPEYQIAQVMEQLNEGKLLEVKAYDRNQTHLLATGKLLTVDNQIDTSTGTVKLKAELPNDNNALFPSQFVNVQLWIKTLTQATLVPTAAIQHGAKGGFVFLLNQTNNTVHIKPVIVNAIYKNDSVINSEVKPGEYVVIEGADKLVDGTHVRAQKGMLST